MKKVLLLGDSIRVAYQPRVQEKLAGIAEVVGPAENCQFAKFTLFHVGDWIAKLGAPDVIHWNNGLWDVYRHSPERGIFTPLEEYLSTLRRLLIPLRSTGASILWATTTPVLPGHLHCRDADIDLYNSEAAALMRSQSVRVNDLNKLVKQNRDSFIGEDFIHLTAEGNEICADAVAEAVKNCI